jgi:hypothetical protein
MQSVDRVGARTHKYACEGTGNVKGKASRQGIEWQLVLAVCVCRRKGGRESGQSAHGLLLAQANNAINTRTVTAPVHSAERLGYMH